VADYGQFCPVAKATGIVGERMPDWLGTCSYADIRPADQAMMQVAADDPA